MFFSKVILGINAFIWITYGIWLFFYPQGLTWVGYGLDHWSALIEVTAMYGAVEVMLGVFALLGIFNPQRYMHSALLLWFFIFSALAVGRAYGIATIGGGEGFSLVADFSKLPDNYNSGCLFFYEGPFAILFFIALRITKKIPGLN